MHIRKRLVIWHAGILAGLLLVFGSGFFFMLLFHLRLEVDETLFSWSQYANNALRSGEEKGSINYSEQSNIHSKNNPVPNNPMPDSFAVVAGSEGLIYSTGIDRFDSELAGLLKDPGIINDGRPLTRDLLGQPFRIRLYRTAGQDPNRRRVLVGRSLVHYRTTLANVGRFIAVAWLLAVLAAFLLSWVFVGRILKPVSQMTRDSLQITGSGELGRRIHGIDSKDEFGELAGSLNRMLASLELSNTVLRDFLADASHELRTPLTSIRANLEFLSMPGVDVSKELSPVLSDVKREVRRMTTLVNQLLQLARTDTLVSAQFQSVDLAALMGEVLEIFRQRPDLSKRFVYFSKTCDVRVWGDHESLRKLAVILLDNAFKYTPDGGTISLDISEKGSRAVVAVSDNGPGIPRSELSLVLNRFYRAGNTKTTVEGTGLGLTIAQAIVNRHQGALTLRNIEPHGLRVEVELDMPRP